MSREAQLTCLEAFRPVLASLSRPVGSWVEVGKGDQWTDPLGEKVFFISGCPPVCCGRSPYHPWISPLMAQAGKEWGQEA